MESLEPLRRVTPLPGGYGGDMGHPLHNDVDGFWSLIVIDSG